MECLEHSLEGKLFYKRMIGGLLWNISRTYVGGEHKLCYKRMIGGLFQIFCLPHNPIHFFCLNFCESQIRENVPFF